MIKLFRDQMHFRRNVNYLSPTSRSMEHVKIHNITETKSCKHGTNCKVNINSILIEGVKKQSDSTFYMTVAKLPNKTRDQPH